MDNINIYLNVDPAFIVYYLDSIDVISLMLSFCYWELECNWFISSVSI